MEVVPLTELDDALFASALAVQQRAEQSVDPAIPAITGPELRRWAAHDRTEGNRHDRFAIVAGDRARAVVHLELELDEANSHRANVEIFGAAWDLDAGTIGLIAALDIAEAEDRTVITGWGPNTDDERRFWTDMGATLSLRERVSALDMAAVDAELMDAWIADGAERAPDVEIVRWVDRCPDEHMAPWIDSQMAMNDMPLGGLDINAWEIDEDDVRRDEGRAAAHTRVHVNPTRPSASYQRDTAVVDRHRGRGIGKWINVAMGYVPVIEFGAWQAPLAEMRSRLSRPESRSSG